jgi:hypothetical protein
MFDKLLNWCCQNNSTVVVIYIVLLAIMVWLFVVTVLLLRLRKFMERIFGNSKKDDLKGILVEYLQRIGEIKVKTTELDKIVTELGKKSKQHISKMGIIRYNPFDDTGGNQSFVLTLLDDYDNGVVITGLYNRDQTRIYTKPVKNGQEEGFEFSKEEKEAIKSAQGGSR